MNIPVISKNSEDNTFTKKIKPLIFTLLLSISSEVSAKTEGILNKEYIPSDIGEILPDHWSKFGIYQTLGVQLGDTSEKYRTLSNKGSYISLNEKEDPTDKNIIKDYYKVEELTDFIQWTHAIYDQENSLFHLYRSLADNINIHTSSNSLIDINKDNLNYTLLFLLNEIEKVLLEENINSQEIINKIKDKYPKISDEDLKKQYLKEILREIGIIHLIDIRKTMIEIANTLIPIMNKKQKK